MLVSGEGVAALPWDSGNTSVTANSDRATASFQVLGMVGSHVSFLCAAGVQYAGGAHPCAMAKCA